jgi:hypothetical protein
MRETYFLRLDVSGRRLPEPGELTLAVTEETNAGVEGWRIVEAATSEDPKRAEERGRAAGAQKRDASELETARRVIDRIGPPPPGEGTHPLQRHRDSMG